MPRPEKFTEKTRRQRLDDRPQQYDSDERLLRQITVGDDQPPLTRSKPPPTAGRLPFEETAGDHVHSLQTHLGINKPSYDLAHEFAWLLVNTKQELQRQLQLIRPTPGELSVTVADGAKHAGKLRQWSDSLPPAFFHNVTVLIPGDPPLRAVIEHLAQTFELLGEIYPKAGRGRPPGHRDATQAVAAPLMLFAFKHAPDAAQRQRRVFVRECLRLIGMECPDPNDHPAVSARWFRPVETSAKRGRAVSLARSRARAWAQAQRSG